MQNRDCVSGLPTSQELAVAGAGSLTQLQLRIYWEGGWVDEMQNKAEAQPAWLQLAAEIK